MSNRLSKCRRTLRASSHESNLANAGDVRPRVKSRKSASTVNPAIRSSSRSTVTRAVDICRSYALAGVLNAEAFTHAAVLVRPKQVFPDRLAHSVEDQNALRTVFDAVAPPVIDRTSCTAIHIEDWQAPFTMHVYPTPRFCSCLWLTEQGTHTGTRRDEGQSRNSGRASVNRTKVTASCCSTHEMAAPMMKAEEASSASTNE